MRCRGFRRLVVDELDEEEAVAVVGTEEDFFAVGEFDGLADFDFFVEVFVPKVGEAAVD